MMSRTTNKVGRAGGPETTPTLRRMRWGAVAFGFGALVVLLASQAAAQAPQPATLTLEEAIRLARQNSPTYRQTLNDEGEADWGAREAYANFLPNLNLNNRYSYQAGGTPRVGNLSAADFGLGETPSVYTSDYSISANMSISGATFFQVKQARANQAAVEARIDLAGFDLATTVTRQYLAALRQRDNVELSRSALERAEEAHKLAEARHAAGAATRLEVAQAAVDRGRAEVNLVQAENNYDTERVRLMQAIGVDVAADIELTSRFEVFAPAFTIEELTDQALRRHPGLVAARKSESAASASAKAAWSTYLPSLSFFGQWSGYVRKVGDNSYVVNNARNSVQSRFNNCQFWNTVASGLSTELPGYPEDCSAHTFTAADEARVLAANDQYPFNWTSSPAYFQVSVSVPIFDGFTRERQLQQARAAADDAKHARRDQELSRRTEITTNLLALRTAYRLVQLESRNAETAGLALELAREQYRLGAGSILELTQAQENKAIADQAHLAAVYTFHESLAGLEAAVGVQLRADAPR